jgi:hypothetical protein
VDAVAAVVETAYVCEAVDGAWQDPQS